MPIAMTDQYLTIDEQDVRACVSYEIFPRTSEFPEQIFIVDIEAYDPKWQQEINNNFNRYADTAAEWI